MKRNIMETRGVKQRNPNFELEFGNPKDEEEEALSS